MSAPAIAAAVGAALAVAAVRIETVLVRYLELEHVICV